ncbi:MAG: hypothetical protein QNK37_20305 [Acidobacteriota bacterium]|nr:hypothetical protein [Acidobacteriota bacterium]
MNEIEFSIRFPDASAAQANQWAADLKQLLEETHPDVRLEQVRDREETMDLGATLGIILGSAAVTAVARGIQAWLTKRQDASIEFAKDGRVTAKGLRGKDALALAELILKQNQ